jgi:hypothetical protein
MCEIRATPVLISSLPCDIPHVTRGQPRRNTPLRLPAAQALSAPSFEPIIFLPSHRQPDYAPDRSQFSHSSTHYAFTPPFSAGLPKHQSKKCGEAMRRSSPSPSLQATCATNARKAGGNRNVRLRASVSTWCDGVCRRRCQSRSWLTCLDSYACGKEWQ